jgi:hypothetical protein
LAIALRLLADGAGLQAEADNQNRENRLKHEILPMKSRKLQPETGRNQ